MRSNLGQRGGGEAVDRGRRARERTAPSTGVIRWTHAPAFEIDGGMSPST